MDSRAVGDLLEDCVRAAEAASLQSKQPTEAERLSFCSCRGQTQDGDFGSVFMWAQEKFSEEESIKNGVLYASVNSI